MKFTIKKKSKEEQLQKQYSDLMKKSFKKALKDKEQSDLLKEKAEEIFKKISDLKSA